jgi:hypothetical protein
VSWQMLMVSTAARAAVLTIFTFSNSHIFKLTALFFCQFRTVFRTVQNRVE